MKRVFIAAFAALAFANATPAAAATLIVDDDGKLTGATGVDILGVLYDVQFIAGQSYSDVYADTAALNSLPYSMASFAGGLAAAQSLLDQVFVGMFDEPGSVLGCDAVACLTSVGFQFDGTFGGWAYAVNNSDSYPYPDRAANADFALFDVAGSGLDSFTASPGNNVARFTLSEISPPPVSGAVPEPATWAMMLLGFLGIGGTMRSVRNRQRTIVKYS